MYWQFYVFLIKSCKFEEGEFKIEDEEIRDKSVFKDDGSSRKIFMKSCVVDKSVLKNQGCEVNVII